VGSATPLWPGSASFCIQLACARAQQLVVSCWLSAWPPWCPAVLLPRDPLPVASRCCSPDIIWGPGCYVQLISAPLAPTGNTPLPLLPLLFLLWRVPNTSSEVLLRPLYKPAARVHPITSITSPWPCDRAYYPRSRTHTPLYPAISSLPPTLSTQFTFLCN
jgi:hypothetical protein